MQTKLQYYILYMVVENQNQRFFLKKELELYQSTINHQYLIILIELLRLIENYFFSILIFYYYII